MQIRRTTRSLTAWIALFAILLAAIGPALSHTLSLLGDGAGWVEVCTVAGTKLVAVDGSGEKGKAGDVDLFPSERCAFCSTHVAVPALPSVGVMPFVLKSSSAEFPSLYFHAPRPMFAWAAAHPRAPPVLS
ncbi:DUF2946 domain-containing protein [Aromatoleum diolicum]|uniref:DUF2946 domain-containing protein n=1 Tax=Aromatoleum diolicum TaxID=75796 RepID=A0ABX1QDQ9_9RHOO|nr:DUF2946 domain-containing protein [Aromatoleum diolicum]NMG75541.1 DUF2946 domain-containing protein [Aromatoleum diolicum]